MSLNIKSLKQRVIHLIWESKTEALSRWQAGSIMGLRVVHLIIRDLVEGQITLRAMGLVYTTLLSIVPLLAVSFSVLKGFGVHNQVEPMLLNLLAPLGEQGIEITNRIIGFVDNIKVGVLGSVGLAFLFYTVISLLQKIEHAFNYTWRVSAQRPLSQRFSDYLSVILIGPVLVFSALGISASVGNVALVKSVIEVETIGLLLDFIGRLIPYLLMIAAFTFIYLLVPYTKVKITSALVGGFVAGILWETTGWVFATFVANSAKYTAIYSVFASLIIFLIWLYLNWLILLIGCSIAFYHQHPQYRNLQSRVIHLSSRIKEKLSLLIMSLIGKHYYQNGDAWTLENMAKELNVSIDECAILLKTLITKGLLVKTAEEIPTYLPAHALETILLKDIVLAVRSAEESSTMSLDSLPPSDTVDSIYVDIEGAIDNILGKKTLRDVSLPGSTNTVSGENTG